MRHEPTVLNSVDVDVAVLRGPAHGSVRGPLFELSIEQHYRIPHGRNIEARRYTFPLPVNSELNLDVRIGERSMSTVVVERIVG